MTHTISINREDNVEMKHIGENSEKDNTEMIERSCVLINELLDRGKEPLLLVDLTQTNHFTPPNINAQAKRDCEPFKLAGFGISNPNDQKTVEQIIINSGSNDRNRIRINKTGNQALTWLKS